MSSFEYPRKLRKPKFFQCFHRNQKGSLVKNGLMFNVCCNTQITTCILHIIVLKILRGYMRVLFSVSEITVLFLEKNFKIFPHASYENLYLNGNVEIFTS